MGWDHSKRCFSLRVCWQRSNSGLSAAEPAEANTLTGVKLFACPLHPAPGACCPSVGRRTLSGTEADPIGRSSQPHPEPQRINNTPAPSSQDLFWRHHSTHRHSTPIPMRMRPMGEPCSLKGGPSHGSGADAATRNRLLARLFSGLQVLQVQPAPWPGPGAQAAPRRDRAATPTISPATICDPPAPSLLHLHNFTPTSLQLHSGFTPASHQLHTGFAPGSLQLQSGFTPTLLQLCFLWFQGISKN